MESPLILILTSKIPHEKISMFIRHSSHIPASRTIHHDHATLQSHIENHISHIPAVPIILADPPTHPIIALQVTVPPIALIPHNTKLLFTNTGLALAQQSHNLNPRHYFSGKVQRAIDLSAAQHAHRYADMAHKQGLQKPCRVPHT